MNPSMPCCHFHYSRHQRHSHLIIAIVCLTATCSSLYLPKHLKITSSHLIRPWNNKHSTISPAEAELYYQMYSVYARHNVNTVVIVVPCHIGRYMYNVHVVRMDRILLFLDVVASSPCSSSIGYILLFFYSSSLILCYYYYHPHYYQQCCFHHHPYSLRLNDERTNTREGC